MALLQVDNLTVHFGGLRAVHDFNVAIESGQIRGLIGPNGAGKTTVFNLITGIHQPTEGKITLDGKSLLGLQSYQIGAMGIARTFQNLRLWRHMTAIEHVKLARYSQPVIRVGRSFLWHVEARPGGSRDRSHSPPPDGHDGHWPACQ